MKSTPSMASSILALVLGAVWPTYSPTRSAREASTKAVPASTPRAA